MTGRISLLAFVGATGVVHCFARMPDHASQGLVLALAIGLSGAVYLVAPSVWRWRLLLPLWAFVVGVLLTVGRIDHRLADALSSDNEHRVARVELRVASLVKISPDSRQFEAQVISSVPGGVPTRIYVTWSAPGWSGPYGSPGRAAYPFPDLIPGQVWRMAMVLKRPHGVRNPHGFDYEGYMFAHGLRATGTVRGTPQYLYDEPWTSLPIVAQRARHHVRTAMQRHLHDKRYAAVLLALAIGDQASVPAGDWEVFNRTGITHLVSISGSHITMIAALGGASMFHLWRRLRVGRQPLAARLPAQIAAALVALLIAWLYCLLAGWGVPARRTFLMLTVMAAAYVWRLPLGGSRLLALVAGAVTLLDPWALLASGYWLSFGAVYVLMAGVGWAGLSLAIRQKSRLQRTASVALTASRLQLTITLGLMPFLALIFNEVSIVSPLVNAYAIPVVSLVVTPMALLLAATAFIPGAEQGAAGIAWLGHMAFELMMRPTVWLAGHELASLDTAAAPLVLLAFSVLGLAVALQPPGFPYRNMGWLFMLPVLFWRPERPAEGEWTLFALDVGQSSAIVIHTKSRVIVFDTGLRGGPLFDEGARTVWPFLRSQGSSKIDALVVSHADIDHAGGMRSVLAAMPVDQSYSSFDLPAYLRREAGMLGESQSSGSLPAAVSACVRGHRWEWDGVTFEFLWPLDAAATQTSHAQSRQKSKNAEACVLRIQGRHHSVLLPADIGAAEEGILLERGLESVDVVLAAHHGSKSSSSVRFVQAVQAAHVIAQVGNGNRYGHPSPQVEARWRASAAMFWRTDKHGAITVTSRANGLSARSTRQSAARYWQTY